MLAVAVDEGRVHVYSRDEAGDWQREPGAG